MSATGYLEILLPSMYDPEGGLVISKNFKVNNSLSLYTHCTESGKCIFTPDFSVLFKDEIDKNYYYSKISYVIFDGYFEVPYQFTIIFKSMAL